MPENQKSTRDKLAILIDMLTVCRTPVRKTRILYMAKLNFYQLTKYLDLLIELGMIEAVESQFKCYRITEKGLQFIKMFEPPMPKLKVIEYVKEYANSENLR